ncbi:DNA cytosine methyltransferase [Catellatospora sp. NPDC049609]|uniref:DNA cytosine methyltransferase n=1 Tax=Catellatospora sp. NPDC049609 TaxID=3155505 RepID=UPI00342D388F
MKLGSLFSGYGGLDLAVNAELGTTTAWHCEFERAPSLVLDRHWPGVPNLGDITSVNWSEVDPVDVLAGGFPCQDVSVAASALNGRHGIAEGTRSGLWRNFAVAIHELRPELVLIENVRGLLSARAAVRAMGPVRDLDADARPLRAVEAVLGDLADLGYDARWLLLPASAAGAPHERNRVFVLAWPAAPDADRFGLRGRGGRAELVRPPGEGGRELVAAAGDRGPDPAGLQRWGAFAPAIEAWSATVGRDAPHPTEPNSRSRLRLTSKFCEWMMGLPEGWVTDTPGVSREQAMRLLGNGVVPQQARLALRLLLGRV